MPGFSGGCAVRTDGREGTVVSTDDQQAAILIEADAACGRGVGCSHCSLFKPESHTIQVPCGDLAEGDRVRLVVSPGSAYRSIVLLFGLPMGLAVVGYFVGARLAGTARDVGGFLGCVGGFALAIVIALVVNRRLAGVSDLVIERIGRPPAGD
jgi:positive regulator of sigma E activity